MRMGMPIGRPNAPIGKEQAAGGPAPDPIDPITTKAIEIAEMPQSRRFGVGRDGKASMTRLFQIKNTNDPIIASMFGPAPDEAFAGGLVVKSKEYSVVVSSASGATPILELSVEYGESDDINGGGARETDTFTLEQETVTVKEVREGSGTGPHTQSHYPSGDAGADDIGTLIGFNRFSKDGEVEGAPITLPIRTLVSVRFTDTITTEEIRAIDNLAPSINKGSWLGFNAGEVLFLGGNPVYEPSLDKWKWSYTFKIRADRSVAGGNTIDVWLTGDAGIAAAATSIPKRGWDYLWYENTRTQSGGGPVYAHVAKVYDEQDFNLIFSAPAEPDKWIV